MKNLGFTIVELLMVIVILGILIGLTAFGYRGWQQGIAEREVKSDLNGLVASLNNYKNFNSGYPLLTAGSAFDAASPSANLSLFKSSDGVALTYVSGDNSTYCIDAVSTRKPSVKLFITQAATVKYGSCASGEEVPNIGETWIARTITPSATLWYGVAYGNGMHVAVGTNSSGQSTRASSPDGITWTPRGGGEGQAVTYANGLFVSVDDTYGVDTSPDGITWTGRSAPAGAWEAVTYGNGMFVAVGVSGAVMSSPNGITWTARSGASAAWGAVVYGNGLFVALSRTSSTSMTSPDGITWTTRSMPASSFQSVIFVNNMFVAVGNSGRVMTSPDGITWTLRTSPSSNIIYSVAYGAGMYVAVGNFGTVMTSPDAITWTLRTPAESNSWHSVTYYNGRFVAVSTNGTSRVMTTP